MAEKPVFLRWSVDANRFLGVISAVAAGFLGLSVARSALEDMGDYYRVLQHTTFLEKRWEEDLSSEAAVRRHEITQRVIIGDEDALGEARYFVGEQRNYVNRYSNDGLERLEEIGLDIKRKGAVGLALSGIELAAIYRAWRR
jgi:hypothetical protein